MLPRPLRRILFAASILAAVGIVPSASEAQLRSTLVASGLTNPLAFVAHPTDPGVAFVVEQGGRIRVLRNGDVLAQDFLDLRAAVTAGGERGLLGLAFAPDYATSGRFFVCFTDTSGRSVVARFVRSAGDALRAEPSSRFDLQWPGGLRYIDQPFSNHNGGHLAFGPDGFLYLGLGDGGSGNDPDHRAQNPRTLLGKMLRINVAVPDSDPEGYNVPPGNPFAGRSDVLPEIWAFGVRNPWRWNFDDPARGGTGAMVMADVGQNRWEEINYEPAGASGRNYGWRNREGRHDNVTSIAPFFTPLREPIFEYSHDEGRSITGGYVYRGRALGADFVGRYFFADFVSGRVWSLALAIDPVTREATAGGRRDHTAELGAAASAPASFGVDLAGELYLVNLSGSIYRIEGLPGVPPADPPPPPGSPDGQTRRRGDAPATGQARPR